LKQGRVVQDSYYFIYVDGSNETWFVYGHLNQAEPVVKPASSFKFRIKKFSLKKEADKVSVFKDLPEKIRLIASSVTSAIRSLLKINPRRIRYKKAMPVIAFLLASFMIG
jgi:hypothetical protein